MTFDAADWAKDEFGDACLGDARRTGRVVRMAREAARRPAPTISKTFGRSAAAEAAFRLVENPDVSVDELASALTSALAAARRVRPETPDLVQKHFGADAVHAAYAKLYL